MIGYVIPPSVEEDFGVFSQRYHDFISGKMEAASFKAHLPPFGIYEQREPDTYMFRVKLAGGLITPRQFRTLGELARKYGHGKVHVTTRACAQLHHIGLAHFLEVTQALHEVGLTGRGGGGNTVRNITSDPYGGIATDEAFDVTPHAIALTEEMLRRQDSFALPRKFKIAFSGSPADRGGATYIDVGFIARVQEGQRGFRVFVGGGMGTRSRLGDPFVDFLPEGDVFILTQAIKEIFNEHGNRTKRHHARLRFLVEDLGLEPFRKLVMEKIPALRALNPPLSIVPLAEVAPQPDEPPYGDGERFVIAQKQAGHYCVKLPLPSGDMDSSHIAELLDALESVTDNEDVIRFCAGQNIYLRNLTATQLRHLQPLLGRLSPIKFPVIGNIIVCTGAATCQLGITRPRGALPVIERALLEAGIDLDLLNEIRIHLSGCPNNCGKHSIADLGFFGKLLRKDGVAYPAYNVFAGARIGEGVTRFAEKIADISAFRLPEFIVQVMKGWLIVRQDHASFADWVDQGGKQAIMDMAHVCADIPHFDDDKNPYFDYSSKELFSIRRK